MPRLNPILQRRRETGLNQRELARIVGVTAMTVSRWERGVVPRHRYWRKLAKALGASIAHLVFRARDVGEPPVDDMAAGGDSVAAVPPAHHAPSEGIEGRE